MVFVTVGSDVPFDRLIRVIDEWAGEANRSDVFAQIGEEGEAPQHIPHARLLEPPEFNKRFAEASIIIAHAGMGTILSALHQGKPILVMPRRGSLGETRNEHQVATANWLAKIGGVYVAHDEEELRSALEKLETLKVTKSIGSSASAGLVGRINDFIHERKQTDGANE